MHTGHAGDFVDNQLIKEIQSKYNGAQITKDMARRWKEAVLLRFDCGTG